MGQQEFELIEQEETEMLTATSPGPEDDIIHLTHREAPVSLNGSLYDPDGVNVQITIRAGATGAMVLEVCKNWESVVDWAVERDWTTRPVKPAAPAQQPPAEQHRQQQGRVNPGEVDYSLKTWPQPCSQHGVTLHRRQSGSDVWLQHPASRPAAPA
jgi:hypothetical protein